MIEVDVRMTLDDLNVCLMGLGKLPLEASMGTWARLKQAGEKAVEEARKKEKEKADGAS